MEEQEIDLRDYVKVIVKRWWVIAGITFISVLVSGIVVLNLPKSYESTALLELANVNKKILENISVTTMIIKNLPEPYMREIARKLKLEETESNIRGLAKSFELKETGKLIQIIGIQNSPDKAKELVEIISNIVIDRHDNLLQKEKDVINAEIAILDEQLATNLKMFPEAIIIADCAEPKAIAALNVKELNVVPCEKGKDSVKFGIKHVQGLKISYTKTSTNLKKEYENYAWKRLKDTVEEDDHLGVEDPACANDLMAAARYGLNALATVTKEPDYFDRLYEAELKPEEELEDNPAI